MEKKYLELKEKVKLLEKKDIDLIIADFDNTIFCRKEQLEKSETLRNNRWNKWNDAIKDILWIEKTIDLFYKDKKYPKIIPSKLRKNHDLILTAWYEDIQKAKIKACKLEHINMIVVLTADQKIYEMIKYVVNDLWFIPSFITVYEDRPNYFIENKDFIEEFLWIKVEIILVEMIDNFTEPKTKKIA